MSFVRSFVDVAPPARFDAGADPFTVALIQEAAEREGAFETIESITLSPVDTDPSKPLERNLTTDKATLAAAWYRVVWEDASGDTFAGASFYVPALPDWAPTVRDVAALIRARTKIPGGGEAGTFNENTRPTGLEVEALIYQAVRRVSSAVGGEPCSDELRFDASGAAAIYAAMLAEQSYYPEQTRAEASSFRSLEMLWKDQIKTLAAAVAEQCGGQGTGGEDGGGNAGALAAGGFSDGYPLIGRDYPVRW